MSGRPHGSAHSVPIQANHVLAVFLQDFKIRSFGVWRFGKPPNILNGVTHPYPSNSDPLGGNRHFRRVIPKALLREVQSDLFHQSDKQLEVVNGAGRRALVVAAPYVEY